MSELLSSITGGGGGLPQLAPDLAYIANINNPGANITPFLQTGSLDGTSGYVTAINLSGKFVFSALQIANNTLENYDIRLTIDGVPIWDSSKTLPTGSNLLGAISATAATVGISNIESYLSKVSLLLEVQSTSDAAFFFNFIVRPVL